MNGKKRDDTGSQEIGSLFHAQKKSRSYEQ